MPITVWAAYQLLFRAVDGPGWRESERVLVDVLCRFGSKDSSFAVLGEVAGYRSVGDEDALQLQIVHRAAQLTGSDAELQVHIDG